MGMGKVAAGSQNVPVMVVEPYVYQAATSLVGKYAVIETTRGSISGEVIDAKPDHIALKQRDSIFFVRLCEIVWIMPDIQ
ncbi:YuzF family protein [Aquibacillus koreensis]|uniref:YuzF family protein n=2 Tax=Aquibacillus koreensis TaxID=279446 RepID=A0A9X3WLY0_9BACI|nr:YuzF family protein [Aquibacillus koreensis]MCT2535179.1 YuzF family protein [Aquibacillus koreensis]MDC3421038.1 YuzF family protein [Aquibacillus koreensis]